MGSSPGPPQDFLSLVVNGGPPYSPGAIPVDHFSGFFLGNIILVGIVLDIGIVVDESSEDIDLAVQVIDTQQYTDDAIVVNSCGKLASSSRMLYTQCHPSVHKIS